LNIVAISGLAHDAVAALLSDDGIIAAKSEYATLKQRRRTWRKGEHAPHRLEIGPSKLCSDYGRFGKVQRAIVHE
jgi:hypothetical protein